MLFAEITGIGPVSAEAAQTVSSGGVPDIRTDRRLHQRIPFDHRARIFPLIEGASVNGGAVLIRDISVGGIGFLCPDPISVGDEFVIRLPTHAGQPIDIQCAARRCEMSGTCGSQFAVGATIELVLNRPLSTAVAPESELLPEGEPILDQPAAPTIEQRYDQQCATSRLIKPIIRETRWDRWLAKPPIKQIHGLLTRIFWPVIVVWKWIHSAMRANEDSRIRHRLSAGKVKKNSRSKRPSKNKAAAKILPPPPPPEAPVEQNPEPDLSLMKILHPALFREYEPEENVAPLPLAPALAKVESPSINAPSKPEPVTVTTAPAPVAPPQPEPSATVNPPVPDPVPAPAETPTTFQIEETVAPPEPVVVPHPAAVEPTPAEPPPHQSRPPVAHPRQMRRRPRATFHR